MPRLPTWAPGVKARSPHHEPARPAVGLADLVAPACGPFEPGGVHVDSRLLRSSRPPPIPPAPPPDGEIGPYRLANRIAVGGMAEVFRALLESPAGEARSVVIKRILPTLAADERCRKKFEWEAALGVTIRHPNVVEVISSGHDRDLPYIVLEHVFGVDLWRLNRWLRRNGEKLRPSVAMYVVTEMLAGLEAVHAVTDSAGRPLGIVHLDVSPSNIFLSVHGDVKLGDLGIAQESMRETNPHAPRGERAKGKLGYLSPEQAAARPCDQRSDVFASGTVAAELLMGKPLFVGGSEIAILLAIRDGHVQPFLDITPDLPATLADAIAGALERDPVSRTGSARELREQLLPFVGESEEAIKRELGGIVGTVLSMDGRASDRQALAKTVEGPIEELESGTRSLRERVEIDVETVAAPVRRSASSDPGPLVAFPGGEDAATPPQTPPFLIRATGGETLGPWRYARLVEAVATGTVGGLDMVRVEDGPWQRLDKVPELARHLPPSSRTPTLQKPGKLAETGELRDLSQGGFMRAMAQILVSRETGLLLCHRAQVRKEVYFDQGTPAFVTSNLATEMLGEYLLRHDVVTREELDFALAVMPRFEGRLGDTLNALGLVEPLHLFRHIGQQVRERLLDIFVWDSGQAVFYPGVDPPESGFPLGLEAWELLHAGMEGRERAGLEEDRFAGKESRLLAAAKPQPSWIADLPDEAQLLLATVSAPRTLGELESVAANPARAEDPGRIRRLVAILLEMGAIRWAG